MIMFKKKPNAIDTAALITTVREYISECANPSPDATMRMHWRRKMAELIGEQDPAVTLRKWHEGSKRR